MPQLDKVTFLSQFFWLCVFYLGFYYVLLKHFLPRISRVLALRKRKLNVSQEGLQLLSTENQNIRTHSDNVLSHAFFTSKETFETFLYQTHSWLETTVNTVNKDHYQTINRSYIDSLGETTLSQNILLYHASKKIPTRLAIKSLLEKMKTLKKSSSDSMRNVKKR